MATMVPMRRNRLIKRILRIVIDNFGLVLFWVVIGGLPNNWSQLKVLDGLTILTLVTLCSFIIPFIIEPGIYGIVCDYSTGKSSYLKSFTSSVKKYFIPYIKVTLTLFAISIPFFIPSIIYRHLQNGASLEEVGEPIGVTITRIFPFFILSVLTVYCLAFVFEKKIFKAKAVYYGIQYLINNFIKSLPIIYVLFIKNLIFLFLYRKALEFSYTSSTYWYFTIINSILMNFIEFIIFLITVLFLRYDSEKMDSPTPTLSAIP